MVPAALALALLLARPAPAAPAPAADRRVRPPAVAGQFYPDDAAKLRGAIDAYLASARPAEGGKPIAIVVPHASYLFSGQIAADAFAQAAGGDYDTVVILGPNHTDARFDGVGLYQGDGFRTPLGVAPIDTALAEALIKADPDVSWNNQVHRKEHSVEVQVPFVQRLFPAARILPVIVASQDPAVCARLGRALAGLLKDRRALIVASSDLSHYPKAADARKVDRETLEAIATLDGAALARELDNVRHRGVRDLVTGACGEAPILATIAAARALGADRARIVSYANAADSPAGDPDRVVGYGAVAIATGDAASEDGAGVDGRGGATAASAASGGTDGALTQADERALVSYARKTIEQYVRTGTAPLSRDVPAPLMTRRGVFVTIKEHGRLRGCVGRLVPDGPMHWLTGAMALRAAVDDPRFAPVRPKELDEIAIEVSLLTPLRRIADPAQIVPGRDGVVLVKNGKSAVFLPEIATDEGWTRDQLLDNLCLKAGLPAGAWRSGAMLAVFQSTVLRE